MESTATSLQKPLWFRFLHALCAVAEGAVVLGSDPCAKTRRVETRRAEAGAGERDRAEAGSAAAAACVSAVLGDAAQRLTAMGARQGLARSLGSVYGGLVTQFLDGFRGRPSCGMSMPHHATYNQCVAVTRDGATLLVTDYFDSRSHALHEYRVADGVRLRVIGGLGYGPLQFHHPHQLCVASDGFVFVADYSNDRVQILTPQLAFHSFVGVGELRLPNGVCADDDIIAVSEFLDNRISVFRRADGALLRRFGSWGSGDGQLYEPQGLCFWPGPSCIAVTDVKNHRVCVFTTEGTFVRHVFCGELGVVNIAVSEANELIAMTVANNKSYGRVVALSAHGEMVWASEPGPYSLGVAVHGSTIFALASDGCVVFT